LFHFELVHRRRFTCGPAVNNFEGDGWKVLVIQGDFLFLDFSPQPASGEQPVHINLWADSKNLLIYKQFIERTWRAAAGKSKVVRHRIIPGDWGKVGSGWLTRLL
jgi:hypothetical protein